MRRKSKRWSKWNKMHMNEGEEHTGVLCAVLTTFLVLKLFPNKIFF